jgi:hypothetical protein
MSCKKQRWQRKRKNKTASFQKSAEAPSDDIHHSTIFSSGKNNPKIPEK